MRPEARTLAEAYAYLELTLPAGESWLDYDRYTTVAPLGDGYLLRFAGPYEGAYLTAEVAVAARPAPDEDEVTFGPGRSTLIDPGQWYLIEAGYAGMAQAGVEQLGDGWPDDATYRAIHRAWDNARAAALEIRKFVPDGAGAVPAAACWTDQGRRIYEARPAAFGPDRLAEAAAHYRRSRDEFAARYPAEAVPPLPAEPPLPARSVAEAQAYLDLHPCACGSAGLERLPVEVLSGDADGLVVRYAGRCNGCGRAREFRFRLPQRAEEAPAPYRLSDPSDGPSALLDPGDWLAVAAAYGASAEAFTGRGVSTEDIVGLLTVAAGALDEVLRFLPAGADAVPAGAFWTATGREVYQGDPDLFRRDRLLRERAERWARLGGYIEGVA